MQEKIQHSSAIKKESSTIVNVKSFLLMLNWIIKSQQQRHWLIKHWRRWSRWRRGWQPCCELRENSAVFCIFNFLLFYMLDVVRITVYDRDTLLNIGSSVAQRKLDFEFLNAGGLFTDNAFTIQWLITKYVFIVHCVYWVYVCVFCTLSFVQSVSMYCLYVNCLFFCTVWSTLSRIALTKALVLWWCDNKSEFIWFDLKWD